MVSDYSNVNCFILAAGKGERWKNHTGKPKQLLEFGNESLLERTARILNQFQINNIYIVSNNNNFRLDSALLFPPSSYCSICDTILSTKTLWSQKNLILLGDVFYSEKCLNEIIKCNSDLKFFGRPWPSRFTLCTHGELFGFAFKRKVATKIIDKLKIISKRYRNHNRGNLWNLYQLVAEIPYDSKAIDKSLLTVINDFTDDFDTPRDYERSKKRYKVLLNGTLGELLFLFIVIYLRRLPGIEWIRNLWYMSKPVPWKG